MTKTTSLLGILITIIAGIFLYMKLCSSCGVPTVVEEGITKEVVAPPAAPQPTSYPFALSYGDYTYNTIDNFNFNVSSSAVIEPLSQKVRDGIIPGLRDFLTENKNKVITITGYHKSDENNNSAFPNLGLARANSVKNYFVSQEIPSVQINTMGKLKDDLVSDGKVFHGPVSYGIAEITANEADEIKKLYDKIKADPIVLYFDTADASINLSEKQRLQVADISRYLDKVEKAKCKVVGFTDSEGRRKTNMKLGQKRADLAKAYLTQNGIAEDRIKTESKGPRDPVASNDTDEGRAKNRRTIISIN